MISSECAPRERECGSTPPPWRSVNGPRPRYEDFVEQAELFDLEHEGPEQRHVVQNCVWMNCAPAATFFARRLRAPLERLWQGILGGTEQYPRA